MTPKKKNFRQTGVRYCGFNIHWSHDCILYYLERWPWCGLQQFVCYHGSLNEHAQACTHTQTHIYLMTLLCKSKALKALRALVVAIGGKMRHANPNSDTVMTNDTYFCFLYAPWDLPENCFFFILMCITGTKACSSSLTVYEFLLGTIAVLTQVRSNWSEQLSGKFNPKSQQVNR